MQQHKNMVTGVDIGGTHVTACLIDLDDSVVLHQTEARHFIDSTADAPSVIASWAAVIREAHEKAQRPVNAIGIAMPGPFDYEKGISLITGLGKYESIYGVNVKELLAKELDITAGQIRMINDATAYLAGEQQFGSGKGAESVLGITLGTGLGSAWYMKEEMTDGDLYHFAFRDGVAEDYISARWLVKSYEAKTGMLLPGVREVKELAVNGDNHALFLFKEFGKSLAEVILARFHPHLPARVVLGGNITKAADLFLPACREILNSKSVSPEFVLSSLGEGAAIIGAACLWKQDR
jgi:glucokinase